MLSRKVAPVSQAERKLIAGVFQGGGAKGAAYSGALAALEEEDIWFSHVAGASAGAITAALIACGMEASEIRDAVRAGLATLVEDDRERGKKRGLLSRAERHRKTGAVFPAEALEDWLRTCLSDKAEVEEPTFLALHQKTEIELQVIAANISRREQVIFNYELTPHVDVAKAVVASSAIPGAFAPGHWLIPQGDETAADFVARKMDEPKRSGASIAPPAFVRETIVDGGVWANYPAFIFKDPSFRKWSHLDEVEVDIYGFVLDSGDEVSEAKRYPNSDLAPWDIAIKVNRAESQGAKEVGWLFVVFLLMPFALLATALLPWGWVRAGALLFALLSWTASVVVNRRGREAKLDAPPWKSDSPIGTFVSEAVALLQGRVAGPALALFPMVVVVGGFATLSILAGLNLEGGDFVAAGFAIAFVGAAMTVSAVISSAALFTLHYAAPTIMWSSVGVPATLLAASTRPPAWVGFDPSDRVIRVPVDTSIVDLLTFDLSDRAVAQIHEDARLATAHQLATFAESSPVTNQEAGSDGSPITWVWVGGGVTLAFAAGCFLRSRLRT